MKKISLLSLLLGLMAQYTQAADNTIQMHQDGPNNQAEVTQQGNGNRVIIRQGGVSAPMQDESAERLHFDPRKHKRQLWHRARHGDSQNLQIHQQGGGKLKVESRSGDGKVESNIVSDKAD